MERIRSAFKTLRQQGRKAFIAYLTAGDPDLQTTVALVLALEEAGVDLIEIGVPFSDPTADGPVIQAAARRALQAGTTLEGILRAVGEIRKQSGIPLVLFGYFNPILSYGPERFARDAAAAGVDGLLVVDLPPEEAPELRRYSDKAGLDFIPLIAPTTDDRRAAAILKGATGFVYFISVTGVTGTAVPDMADVQRDLARLRRLTPLPVAVGFGISTPGQAAAIAPMADGVVVGSALVRLIAGGGSGASLTRKAAAFAGEIRRAVDAARRP